MPKQKHFEDTSGTGIDLSFHTRGWVIPSSERTTYCFPCCISGTWPWLVSFNLSHFRGHYCQLLSTTQLRSQGITPGELSDSIQLPSTGKYSNTSLAFNWISSIRNNAFKRRMPQWEQSTLCTPKSIGQERWLEAIVYIRFVTC